MDRAAIVALIFNALMKWPLATGSDEVSYWDVVVIHSLGLGLGLASF